MAGNVQGWLVCIPAHFPSYFVFSNYGLTKHIERCDGVGIEQTATRTLQFTCSLCQRSFGEERYLKQHVGGRKCVQRKNLLERTASFTLALTESPASLSRHSSLSEDEVRLDLY